MAALRGGLPAKGIQTPRGGRRGTDRTGPAALLTGGAFVAIALTFLACSRDDPGMSREKAEAVLKGYDYTEIELQADPNGWSGTAIPENGGYRMRVTVDRKGVMQLQPCGCGGKEPPAAR